MYPWSKRPIEEIDVLDFIKSGKDANPCAAGASLIDAARLPAKESIVEGKASLPRGISASVLRPSQCRTA